MDVSDLFKSIKHFSICYEMIVFSIDAAMGEPGIALNESEMEKTREGCDNKLFLGMIFLLCNVVSSFFPPCLFFFFFFSSDIRRRDVSDVLYVSSGCCAETIIVQFQRPSIMFCFGLCA